MDQSSISLAASASPRSRSMPHPTPHPGPDHRGAPSIDKLLRDYPRENKPLHWTQCHLELANCVFVDFPIQSVVDPTSYSSPPAATTASISKKISPPSPARSPPRDAATDACPAPAIDLVASFDDTSTGIKPQTASPPHSPPGLGALSLSSAAREPPETLAAKIASHHTWRLAREAAAVQLLHSAFSAGQATKAKLNLFFNNRSYHLVEAQLFTSWPQQTSLKWSRERPLSIVYTSSNDIQQARQKSISLIYKPYAKPSNYPLYKSRLEQLTPTKHMHDPCIAAILIALAQRQRASLEKAQLSSTDCTFLVHALVSDFDPKHLRVYTAQVPMSFLDKLKSLQTLCSVPTALHVHTTAVPYQKFSSFQERLVRVLGCHSQERGQESGGKSQYSQKRERESDEGETAGSQKRRRESDKDNAGFAL